MIGRYGPRRVRANRILAVCSRCSRLSLVPMAGETLPWRNAVPAIPARASKKIRRRPRAVLRQGRAGKDRDAWQTYPGLAADCVRLDHVDRLPARRGDAGASGGVRQEPGYWVKPSAHTKQRKTHGCRLVRRRSS